MVKRWVIRSLIALAVVFVVIQVVPYGRDHTNPEVVAEPAWDSQATRDLAVRACYDCHSNETEWRWYTSVAPVSWLTQRDVDEGRQILNFSEWSGSTRRSQEAVETVLEGEMPPIYYLPTHSDARLSDAEKQALADGLRATLSG